MKKRIVTRMALSALAAGAGCGGSSETAFDSTGIALADVPPLYAAALCSAYERCLGKEVYAIFTHGSDCTAETEQRIRNGEFPQFQAQVDAGRIRYAGARMQVCIDAIDALTCDTLSLRPLPACEEALDGALEIGAECALSAECQGAAFCHSPSGTCPAHCVPLLVAGQDCSTDDQCASGLQCSSETKKCVRPAKLAEACEFGAPPCAPGLVCIGKDDTAKASGSCKSPSDTFSAGDGAACDPSAQLCKQGLSCAVDALTANGATFKCVKTGGYAASGACKLAIPEACAAGNYCKAAGATAVVDGSCAPLPAAGDPCGTTLLSSTICPSSTVCVGGKCQALVENGVSCYGDAMCYSNQCVASGCQAALPCD